MQRRGGRGRQALRGRLRPQALPSAAAAGAGSLPLLPEEGAEHDRRHLLAAPGQAAHHEEAGRRPGLPQGAGSLSPPAPGAVAGRGALSGPDLRPGGRPAAEDTAAAETATAAARGAGTPQVTGE